MKSTHFCKPESDSASGWTVSAQFRPLGIFDLTENLLVRERYFSLEDVNSYEGIYNYYNGDLVKVFIFLLGFEGWHPFICFCLQQCILSGLDMSNECLRL